ncbi:putative protein phosphatase 2C 55 [Abeliophyllum distichum]|uniref:Protein phosphatase n=1 Tax=Abeliophyllum distichum TaxID=126358 RepID=A0ABD1V1X1_9LAMI
MDCSGSTRSILSVKETVSCTDSNLKMISAAFYIPKNNPLKPLGDDAHFICELEQTIGVADGVDGWSKKGIDAGIYARNLMSNAADSVRDEMKNKASLTVHINWGKYRTLRVSRRSCACKVQEGDVIIAGTDGLFDNVDEKELETLVFMGLLEDIKPEVLAKKIAMFAHAQAQDPCACTPFQRESIRAGFQRSGGKYDDITVVVALIMSTSMAAWSPVREATPTEFCGEAFDDSPGSWFYFSHPSVTLPLYDLPFSLDGPDLLFPSRCPLNDYTN